MGPVQQNDNDNKAHRIVVVGGGAGGLELTSRLARKLGKRRRASIKLIDRNLSHIWKPLLHKVAAGTADAARLELSYLDYARCNGFSFWPAQLCGLDRAARTLTLSALMNRQGEELVPSQVIPYDTLVIAVGSQADDFGVPGADEYCHFIDSRSQAETFNTALREAILRTIGSGGAKELRIAVIGAGATGVELVAEVSHMFELVAGYGFPGLRDCFAITLIEGGERILAALPPSISQSAYRVLANLGVHIVTQARVVAVDEQGITLQDGSHVAASIKVWAAGIKASSGLAQLDGLETDSRTGQLIVGQTLQTTRDNAIFAFGDCAQLRAPGTAALLEATAQVAHQQARYLADAIEMGLDGRSLKPFTFHYLGSLVSLSRYNAFGSLGRLGLLRGALISGRFAQFNYASLYRLHQLALHGFWRTMLLFLSDKLYQFSKPSVKVS